jgi:hypothetical protein
MVRPDLPHVVRPSLQHTVGADPLQRLGRISAYRSARSFVYGEVDSLEGTKWTG